MKSDNTDNEQLISWMKVFMIGGGFWNQPLNSKYISEKVFSSYSILMKIGCLMWWMLLLGELVRLVVFGYDLNIILSQFGIVVNASKILFKLFVYVRHNLLTLFKDITEKEREIWSSNNEEIYAVYRKNIYIFKCYVVALIVSTMLSLGVLDLSGIIEILKIAEHNKAFNDTVEIHVMYQTLLPLNKLQHLPTFFALQAYLAVIGFLYNCFTHLMFVILLVYAKTQLQILQIRSKNVVGKDDLCERDMKEKLLLLKRIADDHQYIIGFIKEVNRRTKYIILVEFILSSFDLASVSINLITVLKIDSNSPDMFLRIVFPMAFFVLLSVQIYVLGWNCNEIKCESEELGNALYASNWYLLNPKVRKVVQIMIARTQKPMIMTIGPFGPMTTASVLAVLKAAYSYVSIMIR